jgi:hypothetical protein
MLVSQLLLKGRECSKASLENATASAARLQNVRKNRLSHSDSHEMPQTKG